MRRRQRSRARDSTSSLFPSFRTGTCAYTYTNSEKENERREEKGWRARARVRRKTRAWRNDRCCSPRTNARARANRFLAHVPRCPYSFAPTLILPLFTYADIAARGKTRRRFGARQISFTLFWCVPLQDFSPRNCWHEHLFNEHSRDDQRWISSRSASIAV